MVLALLLAALIFWRVNGEHEFSAGDFERATGQQLPVSARIIASESLNWDLQGDHDACALIDVSMEALFAGYKVLAAEYGSVQGGEGRYWAIAVGKPVVMVRYASW
ncbi:hypothetical protein Rhein_3246 [Rheinheimera sp. A13L]|nr:hypothetical protein Rhein_3246 [Rheinheimera sp. A13L]